MTEHEAGKAILLGIIQQNDPEGRILEKSQLEKLQEKDPGRRAEAISNALQSLSTKHPKIAAAEANMSWPGWLTPSVAIGAFLIGLAMNKLGTSSQISIVAFPLLGLLFWNLMIYITFVMKAAMPKAAAQSTRLMDGLWENWQHSKLARSLIGAHQEKSILEGFFTSIRQTFEELHKERMTFLMHTTSSAIVLGLIAGMYLRGLAFEYYAGWGSTFLDENQLRVLLTIILGPASILSGIPIPSAAHLASIRWSTGNPGDIAASWIHLYAITAVIYVLIPRTVLLMMSARQIRRLRRTLSIEPLGAASKPAESSGAEKGAVAAVVPYSTTLESTQREQIRKRLVEASGAGLMLEFLEPILFGEEDKAKERLLNKSVRQLWIAFNMTSTPEEEQQGRLLATLRSYLASMDPSITLGVLLDSTSFRKRFGEGSEYQQRAKERLEAWDRLLRGHGLSDAIIQL